MARYINPKFFTGLFIPDWMFELGMSYGAMICYGRLARLAQQKGHAYPTIQKLAEVIGCSEPTAKGYLAELRKAKLIEVQRTGRASNYKLVWHSIMEDDDSKKAYPPDSDNKEPDLSDSKESYPSDREKVRLSIHREKHRENTKKELPANGLAIFEKRTAGYSEHKQFIEWWCHTYQERFNEPYNVTGQCAKTVQSLLKRYGLPRLKEIGQALLDSTDPFLVNGGKTIPMLNSQWNRLVQQQAKRNPKDNIPEFLG